MVGQTSVRKSQRSREGVDVLAVGGNEEEAFMHLCSPGGPAGVKGHLLPGPGRWPAPACARHRR